MWYIGLTWQGWTAAKTNKGVITYFYLFSFLQKNFKTVYLKGTFLCFWREEMFVLSILMSLRCYQRNLVAKHDVTLMKWTGIAAVTVAALCDDWEEQNMLLSVKS